MVDYRAPLRSSYDVVIIGGAMMGASTSWFLSQMSGFDGSVLVIEMDPSYSNCSTAHSNSCMRQQFSNRLNVQISQFAADFVLNLRSYMGGDIRVPDLSIQNFGYLYLADTQGFADHLRASQALQCAAGAQTELLDAQAIKARYPFYNVDDVILGSINLKNEGYWDGGAVFDWWRRSGKQNGVEYVTNRVCDIEVNGGQATSVTLETGAQIDCGYVVNCAGPRAAEIARMAGIELPVEPRKRFTYVFTAEQPLDRELPLTIDPSGVHVRQDGPQTYMAGAAPAAEDDIAVDPRDFAMDHARWLDHVWPIIATRIPQFEAIRVVTEWAGHYAYNTFDQNAIVGPHPEMPNFLFLNGFSGHGLQQSPAMGRGIAEWITHSAYQTLDLAPFGFERVVSGTRFDELAII